VTLYPAPGLAVHAEQLASTENAWREQDPIGASDVLAFIDSTKNDIVD
jgi:hypothetical protein